MKAAFAYGALACTVLAAFAHEIGQSWTMIPSPGEQMHAVIYGGGQFVAVGKTGQVATSPDGANWTQTAQISATLNDVAYGLGRYLAVTQEGAIFTSTDGINWGQSRPPGTNAWVAAYGSANRLIAVGGRRSNSPFTDPPAILTVLTQTEGWTDHTFQLNPFSAASSSPKGYLVLGSSSWFPPVTIFSPDGAAWQEKPSILASVRLSDVAYGNGVFIAVGGCACGTAPFPAGPRPFLRGTAVISDDGQSFRYYGATTSWSAALDEYGLFYSVAFGRNTFVAVGNWTSVSTTGTNWTHTPTPDIGRSIAYGVGRFVIAAQTNFYYSGDLRPPVQIGAPALTRPNTLSFALSSEPATVLSLERSANLTAWEPALTLTNHAGATNVQVNVSPYTASEFYRAAVLWP